MSIFSCQVLCSVAINLRWHGSTKILATVEPLALRLAMCLQNDAESQENTESNRCNLVIAYKNPNPIPNSPGSGFSNRA
jgi:hypothetical protein